MKFDTDTIIKMSANARIEVEEFTALTMETLLNRLQKMYDSKPEDSQTKYVLKEELKTALKNSCNAKGNAENLRQYLAITYKEEE